MADADRLRPYAVRPYPIIPGGESKYLLQEFRRIEQSIRTINEVLDLLEARIEALEP